MKKSFSAYFGQIQGTVLAQNSIMIKNKFAKLGYTMSIVTYSVYCKGSAMSWVDIQQEGEDQGQHFLDGEGRWYIPLNLRAANNPVFYIVGSQRPECCKYASGSTMIQGATSPMSRILSSAAALSSPTLNIPHFREYKAQSRLKESNLTA